MLVRCPKCRTTYKVSDELLKGSSPAFRCSRCKHTFELEPHSTAEQPAEPAARTMESPTSPAPARDEELSLPFETQRAPTATETDQADRTEQAPSETEGLEKIESDAGAETWSLHDPAGENGRKPRLADNSSAAIEPVKIVDDARDFPDDDPFFSKTETHDTEDETNILAIDSYRNQRASILPFISLFCLLAIGFTLFAVVSYANPQTSERIIKAIPVIGSSVLRNNHLREGILVQSLRSSSQTIQGNREVFLISGVALNQNAEVVREIQLSGVTFNEAGKELERQTIWVGNTISPKIIRGMTAEDIPHLQDLKPLKSFEIPPGDSMPFTIVFLKSAKAAKSFGCEVVAAEGTV